MKKYFKELKDLIDKSDLQNQVSLIGPVDRESVKDYYSTSNLMILPSISEGLARGNIRITSSNVSSTCYRCSRNE